MTSADRLPDMQPSGFLKAFSAHLVSFERYRTVDQPRVMLFHAGPLTDRKPQLQRRDKHQDSREMETKRSPKHAEAAIADFFD